MIRNIARAVMALAFMAGAAGAAARAQAPSAQEARGRAELLGELRFPILFTKRFNYQGLHIYDTFYQWRPGGGIYVLENPASPPDQRRVRAVIDPTTPETLGEGIYFNPSLSYDARRLLFCFKGKPDGGSTIYEIGVDGTGLRRVIPENAAAATYMGSGGGHHDVTPCYLPDGRIAFTSTRYSGLVPCANNGVAILHVMNADGSGIQAISVNNVTEFDPAVLPDGRILFGRWEYVDRNALVIQSLWTVTPDGRDEMELFANNMVFPEALLQAKPIPGHPGMVVATFAPHNAPPRGTIAIVDTRGAKNDPGAIFNFESPGDPTRDRGQSCDPWPLCAEVVLFSGTPREADAPRIALQTPGFRVRDSPVLNAILVMDRAGQPVVVHSDPAIDLHNPIPLVPRETPGSVAATVDRAATTGKFFVHDVYASMPEVPRGTVKWLRVVEETSRVTPSPGGNGLNQTFSISAALAWSAKIYHGAVPVEADGSVLFEAPSGRALYFQLLDGEHRLVRGMRTFIQAAPGVTRSCVGCHEYGPKPVSSLPTPPLRVPQPEAWGSGHLDYPARVQPVFDAKCVSCHGGERGMAAGLDLSRGWTEQFSISYEHLSARRERMFTADMIGGICGMNGTAHWSCKVFGPYSHGSGKAVLADVLLRQPHRDLLTRAERDLVFAWLDSNGMYFGTWDYTDAGPQSGPYLRAVKEVKAVMREAGCVRCHGDARGTITRFDQWINLDRPELSRVLRAPLPASTTAQGGYGLALCRDRAVDSSFSRRGVLYSTGYAHAVMPLEAFPKQAWPSDWPPAGEPVVSFSSPGDPHYRKMLAIIHAAREAQLAVPRIDMPGAEWKNNGIRAGRSRQMLPVPLPDPLPELRAERLENGMVRLSWEASARMIGLTAEIHRSASPGFSPDDATRVGSTVRQAYVDTAPGDGLREYAVVFLSGPTPNCGAQCPEPAAETRRSAPIRTPAPAPQRPSHAKGEARRATTPGA